MTAPLHDDPYEGLPLTSEARVVGRDLAGLLLVIAGVVALTILLFTVDWRWAAGLLAVAAIAGGIALGTHDEGS